MNNNRKHTKFRNHSGRKDPELEIAVNSMAVPDMPGQAGIPPYPQGIEGTMNGKHSD